ncbi:MAG: sigma 54-interacting transcriptional regulator, partial [Myxococcales bacterium]|nr:sigma 54-interacting transcriptional regulator [Myxococcales bacterium]
FGYEKGAFSGADRPKTGRVEAAGRGTLFLDEIGELEMPMQAKLLRLLEEREFTRVGSTRARRLDARIITATNRRLDRAVREGKFRADLRYRLAVFVVELPPLSERGEDVLLLARHFADERARVLGRPPLAFHHEVVDALPRYPFPGNVRELRNMVEQAVVLARDDELVLDDFPVLARTHVRTSLLPPGIGEMRPSSMPPPRLGASRTLAEIRERHQDDEQRQLVAALDASRGNVTLAARRLGLSRFQLLRRLKKYGLR